MLVAQRGSGGLLFGGAAGGFGLAHGIGAGLALLSLAVLGEQKVPGAHEAIARICAWTDQWQQGDNNSPWWPGFITPCPVRARSVDASLRPWPS
ncbi:MULTISPECIES: hypothetical protein [unclassified Streptomyces]|uniref:hypothetical protein n=1 Tax=unclassified Streptomyces TaxID=2593676 RepID=UPI000DAE3124|nr:MULTISPECIES: hypothetical protein [unclassified Streptomyces]PZT73779.1 hypothetical protein DNK55_16290 [Streptomyces sp. AC1-42T]PZT83225.1 hypothetical protein DNK56_15135 [Streptomyces sp. AC1-42W]